jgi:hypothetical protein
MRSMFSDQLHSEVASNQWRVSQAQTQDDLLGLIAKHVLRELCQRLGSAFIVQVQTLFGNRLQLLPIELSLTAAQRTRRWDRPRTAPRCLSSSLSFITSMNGKEDEHQTNARGHRTVAHGLCISDALRARGPVVLRGGENAWRVGQARTRDFVERFTIILLLSIPANSPDNI